MLFLDTPQTSPNIKIVSADSIQTKVQEDLQMAASDPTTFWTNLGEQALHFGMKVLAALAIYLIGAWLIKRLKKVLERIFQRRKTEETLASFITSFVSILLTVVVVIIAVSTLGVDTTSLAALLAAGGMAIGMALSGTVQNFAGGIMLLVFKPFKVGDVIEAQGYLGQVMDVNIVSTKILTYSNHVIILPNGALFNGNIDNHDAQPLRRVEWQVSVAYGTDADACIEAMKDILQEDPRILGSQDQRPLPQSTSAVNTKGKPIPDPHIFLSSLNANDITFTIWVWVHTEDYWGVYLDDMKLLYTGLPKRGFEFAYPHCDVTILNGK